ncbi:neuralized-like protein 4 [Ischnura elegans]|uniref:neuralized-like protein 4 n=1 Tax=Ischnura elegans TaxID=197161 RepID=UPI001ED8B3DA|nr:neuralized-like protein 4 [Ischnura elegans]
MIFVMTTNKLAISVTCLSYLLLFIHGADDECEVDKESPSAVSLFIGSHRNSTGDWVTSFSVNKGDSDSDGNHNLTLKLSQDVTECRGKKILQIRGVLSGLSSSVSQGYRSIKKRDLFFHDKCGSNVAILNNGLQARKINVEESSHAVVFTHRPLEINETLEIKLEKKLTKFPHCLGIGVTTTSPNDFPQIPQHIDRIKNKSWAWYITSSYLNGEVYMKTYGKNLDDLNVGDRAAVKRTNTGALHFYYNGVDQGPAFSNIPHPVYGVVELYGNAAMVSIVEN